MGEKFFVCLYFLDYRSDPEPDPYQAEKEAWGCVKNIHAKIIWAYVKVPGEPTDILYSALHRAVSWHGGHITIITPSSYTKHPDWVFDLGVEALPVREDVKDIIN